MKVKATGILILLLIATNLLAQEAPIRGHVRDRKGEPVVGATITSPENSATAITDLNGDFVIDVPAGTKLEVTFIGLIPEKKKAVNNMIITMQEKRSLSWNVRAGTHLSIYIDYYFGETEHLRPGFQLGVGMEIPFNNTWSLQPSVVFITKRNKFTMWYLDVDPAPPAPIDQEEMRGQLRQSQSNNSYPEADINPLFINIPILVSARFGLSDKTNMVIGLGPYVGCYIGGKITYTSEQKTWKEDVIDNNFKNKLDCGFATEIKVEMGKFFVGLNGYLTLLNLVPDTSYPNDQLNMVTAGLLVGYQF